MKIALAVLAMAPVMLVAGCKEKPPAPPPPDPILGAWACAITAESVAAKIDTTFAGDGTLTAKIAITANPGNKRAIANLDAAGKWSRKESSLTQALTLTVTKSTLNGVEAPEASATALARSLALNGKGVVIRKIDAVELVYETRAGLVNCRRQAQLPAGPEAAQQQ